METHNITNGPDSPKEYSPMATTTITTSHRNSGRITIVDSAGNEIEMPDDIVSNEVPDSEIPVPLKLSSDVIMLDTNTDGDKITFKDSAPKKSSGAIQKLQKCINFECNKRSSDFIEAQSFISSYFKAPDTTRLQYVCESCYEEALSNYEELCGAMIAKKLIFHQYSSKRIEQVDIVNSSDEENECIVDIDKDSEPLPEAVRNIFLKDFESTLKSVIDRLEIKHQIKSHLRQKIEANKKASDEISEELITVQKLSDTICSRIYQMPKYMIEHKAPLDLDNNMPPQMDGSSYPPLGEIVYPPLDMFSLYYCVRQTLLAPWIPAKICDADAMEIDGVQFYNVIFLRSKGIRVASVQPENMAYGAMPTVRLSVGTRVIALFEALPQTRKKNRPTFCPGVIAEPLQLYNRWRYLIFFDDGYAQYVQHDNIRLVCKMPQNVWEDVHPGCRQFIQDYLTQYKYQRPMVHVKKNQYILTEWNGKWYNTRVMEVDASLVKLSFEELKHTEWIYRGSKRLGVLFNASQIVRRVKNAPYVEYVTISEEENSSAESPIVSAQIPVKHMNNSTIYVDDDNEPKGHIVNMTIDKLIKPRRLSPHRCGSKCLNIDAIDYDLSKYSPLSQPIRSGWMRSLGSKNSVTYTSPCGVKLFDMSELYKYLIETQCSLNVENFSFDRSINCLTEYVNFSEILHIENPDISNGQEKMAVPLVNYCDKSMPPTYVYSAVRTPTEGVDLNLDPEFLCGCNCEDGCLDKEKCQCWQLTLAGKKFCTAIGYEFKRLFEPVTTAIYECNRQCKCRKTCMNRVVQHGLEMKLQVFKTANRGWGIRCLNDIPKGSFICVYAADLLTEQNANESGTLYGDEYFADLDYIDVVENLKENFEIDVVDWNDDDTMIQGGNDPSGGYNSDEEDKEKEPISFMPSVSKFNSSKNNQSVLKFFEKNQKCFILDAMKTGNIGRYFNHSCEPNMFVQNVFVDTHDLRFPWVALFAMSNIRAGTELTWDYEYDVGSVPGKILHCQCGTKSCRGRLL